MSRFCLSFTNGSDPLLIKRLLLSEEFSQVLKKSTYVKIF